MSCCQSNIGIYKKGSSVKLTLKFNVDISTFSDIFVNIQDNNGNILNKYSLNSTQGYDSNSTKISTVNPNWLDIYVDTTITRKAIVGVSYNIILDYRLVDSNYTSGVEVRLAQAPILKFTE